MKQLNIYFYYNIFNNNNIYIYLMNQSKLSQAELGNFDRYIEDLQEGKLLSETDIKVVCSKVNYLHNFNNLGKRNPLG